MHEEEVGAEAVTHHDEEEGKGVQAVQCVQVHTLDGLIPAHQAVETVARRNTLADGSSSQNANVISNLGFWGTGSEKCLFVCVCDRFTI